ncbi:sensor histidine kinase [Arthrobacter bambusae]|uniref:sensor histidine kinase n=1 Tax=Arthrobacter bambusae TaxID=1338426 RepID=UPI002782193D|nr:sensor histidine kinase [Arthrobacter bambusae]MDQ0029332.1 signal transduction histidine kinase [Arthrobacter bambusae]MDQ0098241.1 signal transduction histidine kinase [Arthrobacter bambusae]
MQRRFQGPPTSFIVIAVALIQVLGTIFSASHQTAPRALDPLAFMLLLAGPAALAFRSRRPAVMLPVTIAATSIYLLRGYAWGPIVLSLALSIILTAAAGLRWLAWLGAGICAAAVVLMAVLAGDETGLVRASAGVAWAAILVLIGEGFRRRAERMAEYRRRREAAKQAERDEYRLTLARDIHDVVAHSLSMINVQASVALHLGTNDPEKLRPALEAIKAASKESLAEVRQLLGVLRDDAPLSPAAPPSLGRIPELVEDARRGGLQMRFENSVDPELVGAAQQEAAYRIVQEGLSNVRRHSGAVSAVVLLEMAGNALKVRIDDDGGGLRGMPAGNGLRGMRERVEALGGKLGLTALSPGLRVEASLPLNAGPGGHHA